MIGGPSFDATAVPRFGAYDPPGTIGRGHALRLAADDLYDCRWPVAHELPCRPTARSGLYVGRFHYEVDGRAPALRRDLHRPQGGRPPAGPHPRPRPTNTWKPTGARRSRRTSRARPTGAPEAWTTACPRRPAYCSTATTTPASRRTSSACGALAGRRPRGPLQPPRRRLQPPDARRAVHPPWLDEQGYEYDVISDHDLHRDPDGLAGYQVLADQRPQRVLVDPGLQGGRPAPAAGGPRGGALGQHDVLAGQLRRRRIGDGVPQVRPEHRRRAGHQIGEPWHSPRRIRGSLMRECGYPAWEVLGLECVGWWGTGRGSFGNYTTEAPDHLLFREPERVDLSRGETFGHAPGGGEPRAVGH